MVVEALGQPPAPDGWFVAATWTYDYVTCLGEEPLTEHSFAFANVGFLGGGEGDGDGDSGGDGDGDGDGDDGDDDGDGDGGTDGGTGEDGTEGGADSNFGGTGFDAGLDEGDGCNCRSSGSGSPATVFGLLGLFGLLRRLLGGPKRRRRDSVARCERLD